MEISVMTKQTKKLVDLVEQARQLRLATEDLERKVLAAKGTQRNVRARRPTLVGVKRSEYYVGDAGTTDDLTEIVKRMLMEKPMYFRDILIQTGARDNRVKGVITRLQREGYRVVDLSPEGSLRALWFIPSREAVERIVHAPGTEKR